MPVVFAVSVFLSAFFLFLVQPMIARMLLPSFGGSPAVWNTCMLFFQGLVLLGYSYSHYLPAWIGTRKHMALHAPLLVLPILLLPPAIDPAWAPPPDAWPIPALIGALALAAGLPFVVLTTNGSLVQHWYTVREGKEPYFLYAASNAGSLLGLLGYPFVVEPLLDLRQQGILLTAGYMAFVATTLLCQVLTWRKASEREAMPVETRAPAEPLTWRRRLYWVFLAMVPVTVLLAVTLRITTDLAPVPLFWVVPLAIYLLTFIIAFLPQAPYPRLSLELAGMLFVTVGLAVVGTYAIEIERMLAATMGALLFGGWICHGDLARDRPDPAHVTEFFLWISVGGFLGGVFGNLVAPLAFDWIAEFPISLFLLAVVFALRGDRGKTLVRDSRSRVVHVAAIGMVVVVAVLAWVVGSGRLEAANPRVDLTLFVPLVAGIALFRWAGPFLVAASLVAFVRLSGIVPEMAVVDAERSFFGVVRIIEGGGKQESKIRLMLHGTTLHGLQYIDPYTTDPTIYYHPAAPIGGTIRSLPANSRIGVVGLGTGAIAALAKRGQTLTYFELDPRMEPMARKWFDFLKVSPAALRTVVGDARLTLAREPDRSLDFLMVDAFSSDAIPVHLLTTEAIRLYLDKIDEDGMVMMHISNRYLRLDHVLRGAARELGKPAALAVWHPTAEEEAQGALPCAVVVFAHRQEAIDGLGKWFSPFPDGPSVVWTDDYASIFSVFGVIDWEEESTEKK